MRTSRGVTVALAVALSTAVCQGATHRPAVLAHRGASAYLPEHMLEAKAMAHAMGVDHIEQDVAITRDDVPVAIHDHSQDTVTDVAGVFPRRRRPDGRCPPERRVS